MEGNKKTWFVTGASKGLGLTLVKRLLNDGYQVAATSRNGQALQDAVADTSGNFLAMGVDITRQQEVTAALEKTAAKFGSVDVVVNNAGYGILGALEELTDEEARANIEVNVFGSMNVIRQALPYMRSQKSGHIFNISSIGGFAGGFPGFGVYCAAKFAVSGMTEALFQEVKPFNIGVTLVMPGYFRTNFLDGGSIATPKTEIAGYTTVRESQKQHLDDINANQPGDPEKAAEVLIKVAQMNNAPLHLFLGADAYETAGQKLKAVQEDMEAYRSIATKTQFDEESAG